MHPHHEAGRTRDASGACPPRLARARVLVSKTTGFNLKSDEPLNRGVTNMAAFSPPCRPETSMYK